MIRFDFMSLVVFAVQLLLVIPCAWALKSLPAWLQREFHLQKSVSVGAFIVLTVLLWFVMVMLMIFLLNAIKKRRHSGGDRQKK